MLVPYSASLDPAHSSRGEYLVKLTYTRREDWGGRRYGGGVVGRSRERGGGARRASRRVNRHLLFASIRAVFRGDASERARVRFVVDAIIALARGPDVVVVADGSHPLSTHVFSLILLRVADVAACLLLAHRASAARAAARGGDLPRVTEGLDFGTFVLRRAVVLDLLVTS